MLNQNLGPLKALEETDTKDAIKSLERAVGKMELIMARNPELALAPLDVEVIAYDLYATPGTIRMAIKEAEKLLEDGRGSQRQDHLLESRQ